MSYNPRILFLCTGNSCRSQMAEGFARKLLGDTVEPFSAGTEVHGMNERAVTVMAEAGVDISGQRSKTVDELEGEFDFVFTVCDSAAANCPFFPARSAVIHRGFDDPPTITRGWKSEEKILAVYRRVRNEIRILIQEIPGIIKAASVDGETVNPG